MNRQTKISTIIFYFYLMVVVYITLFAWDYGSSLGPHGPGGRNYNIIPFKSIVQILKYGTFSMKIDILLGNVVMFVPFGFLLPSSYKQLPVKFVIPLALGLSTFIELNQFIFTYRVSNIDDVILNTLGGCIGLLIYLSFIKLKQKSTNKIIKSQI